ncbi:MAG: BadF/BadG/BcrA/BcrD ATPase family protein [Anaerolineae bacterium]
MNLFMGIDGGGSALRVVLADEQMQVLTQSERGTANPSSIGKEAAANLLHTTIDETLRKADKTADDVTAAAFGVAGTARLQTWIQEVGQGILPNSFIVPSTDFEIALVGARGERFGVLILAGTGSVAFGVNVKGDSVQVGGWGYLLGDEGSGYWMGMEALKALTRSFDKCPRDDMEAASILPQRLMKTLKLSKADEIISWVYGQPRTAEVARLAELVLSEAEDGDIFARYIVHRAVRALETLVTTVRQRLKAHELPAAFAGGLLTNDNLLSRLLANRLGMTTIPQPLYPPVIGAALLAKLRYETRG